MERQKMLFSIVLVVIVSISGVTLYKHFRRASSGAEGNIRIGAAIPAGTGRGGTQNDRQNTTMPVGVEFDESGKNVPQNVSSGNMTPVPNLDRSVTFAANVPLNQRETISKRIFVLVAALKKNKDAFNAWIDLGIERKTTGDLEGAREAWEYASTIRPSNSLSFGNLGDLYGYYLRDPQKAEQRFLTAIKNDPSLTYLYVQLADFYSGVLGDRSKALAFLKRSVEHNPGNADLKKVLAHY